MQEESKQMLWSARLREHAESDLTILPFSSGQGEPALELQTPHGYVIRLGGQAQVAWLGAVPTALR